MRPNSCGIDKSHRISIISAESVSAPAMAALTAQTLRRILRLGNRLRRLAVRRIALGVGCLMPILLVLGVSACRAQTSAPVLLRPTGLAYDPAGDLFIADADRNQVLEILIAGSVAVVAGNGTQGYSGDGGPASAAELNAPEAVAVAADGSILIADTGNQRVRVVQNGQISTLAGNGTRGFSGDGGPPLSVSFDRPVAVAVEASGGVLICDSGNQRVRRVSAGIVSTVAGNGTAGYSGDGTLATAAELNQPSAVIAAPDGRIYIADTGNRRVRMITADGRISTLAGNGAMGFSGDGQPATSAALSRPRGLALDAAGNLLIVDQNNHRLRCVAPDGTISTLAGSGVQGTSADGATAVLAAADQPVAAAVSSFGWPAIADSSSRTLRLLLDDGKLYAPGGLSKRTTQLSAATPDATYGSARAMVSLVGLPEAPHGSVRVLEGAAQLGQTALTQATASVSLPGLAVGSHTLAIVYGGDGIHPSSTASSTVVVSPAPVTASAASATVSYGALLPAFQGSLSGVLPQDAGNVTASFAVSATNMPAVGSYPIKAVLHGAGSSNYALSLATDSGSLTVVQAGTMAALTTPPTAYEGLPLRLSASVTSTTSGIPTGSVQFIDGGIVVASAPLLNGSATAVYLSPAAGSHTLSVAYSGDSNFLTSSSAKMMASVSSIPDFGVAVNGSSQQTVLAGSVASYGFTIASTGGPFTGAVTFSASGLPPGASANFSPSTVVPGASSADVRLAISTTTQSAQNHRASGGIALAVAGGLLLPMFRRRKQGFRFLLAVSGTIAIMSSLFGCGARTVSESTLAVKSYTITVKGTSTNLAGNVVVHSTDVTLGVQ